MPMALSCVSPAWRFFAVACIALAACTPVAANQYCSRANNNPDAAPQCLVEALLPRDPMSFNLWPGNHFCVSCNFFWGCVFGCVEVVLLFLAVSAFLQKEVPPTTQLGASKDGAASPEATASDAASSCCSSLCVRAKALALALDPVAEFASLSVSTFGWLYWLVIVCTYWNFISYMMLGAVFLLGPLLAGPYLYSPTVTKSAVQAKVQRGASYRRVKACGWVLALLTLALFPNVPLMPSQVYRHIYMPQTMITPQDPAVKNLTSQFYEAFPKANFERATFHEQMLAVDKFIYKKIIWKSDMDQYGMVGLLTTPAEVIERMAGDCQGQAVTTASLLWNLGFEAAVVETPFHWWTYARDNVTGLERFLNQHGNAGKHGNVLPQPIDMVFTRWPDSCDPSSANCSFILANNRENFFFVASPAYAFALAWSSAHIFVRDILPGFLNGGQSKLVTYGIALGLGVAVLASYVQSDLLAIKTSAGKTRFAIRSACGCAVGVFSFLVMFALIFIKYQFTEIHLCFSIGFALNFIASDYFNARIGTPSALRAYETLA
eukprot:TRINITY_DN4374_c0_g1_i1.p1 TRINITY_DN4374_c0_g1~~TRINITY_DN4374_c0_g1_i1.p1  ORF type:complete len:548 (+),score=144.88 TRINITY_DN4374_c0_g1_i1:76-1719(+)